MVNSWGYMAIRGTGYPGNFPFSYKFGSIDFFIGHIFIYMNRYSLYREGTSKATKTPFLSYAFTHLQIFNTVACLAVGLLLFVGW